MTSYRKTFLFLVLAAFMIPGIAAAERLVYEVIEDVYDDVSQIRSVTEQAPVDGGKGWLIRTTVYTTISVNMDIVFVPISVTKSDLFTPIR